jgi:hypothetical protein
VPRNASHPPLSGTAVSDLTHSAEVLKVIEATVRWVENAGMFSLTEGVEDPSQLAATAQEAFTDAVLNRAAQT